MTRTRVFTGVRALGTAVALLLAWVIPGQGQTTGTIQGTVTSRGTSLPGIEIHLPGTTLFGVTGADGHYQIRNVPAGPRAVRIHTRLIRHHLGFDIALWTKQVAQNDHQTC